MDITLGPGGIREKGTHVVSLKTKWGDTWQLAEFLHCVECVDSCAPAIPNASFIWQYGDIKQVSREAFDTFTKRRDGPLFVKVEYDTDQDEPFVWYGVLQVNTDDMGGRESGRQTITAYGFAKLLDDHEILNAFVAGPNGTEIVDVPPAFNARGMPNKEPGSFLFSNDPDTAEYWSSEDIVRYLLGRQTPVVDTDGRVEILFQLAGSDVPNWDKPTLDQQRATTYQLLDQLIDRRRLLLWWLAPTDGGVVELHTDTMVSSSVSIPLPGAVAIEPNHKQITLDYDADQLTQGQVKASDVETVDYVLVRSERRRSVGSFSMQDITLNEGWELDQGTSYQQGDPQATGGSDKKRLRHEAARARGELGKVYSFFNIIKEWDLRVGDGEGGDLQPMFPKEDDAGNIEDTPAFVNFPDMFVEPTMPLYEGLDYSGDSDPALKDGEEPIEMAPFAVFNSPNGWMFSEKIGENADLPINKSDMQFYRWSASVRVAANSKGVFLDVHGAPRHVIDAANFDYLPEDEYLGPWSYKPPVTTEPTGMIVTLSIPDDRWCEGQWPENPTTEGSYLRRLVIWTPGFRKDYIAPNTVVGIDQQGGLLRSDGAFLPPVAEDDDEHQCIAAAKIAAAYYTETRYVLSLATYRLQGPSVFRLGSMVVRVGKPGTDHEQTINSPITELRISSPLGTPDNPTIAQQTVTTWAGELDPFLLVGEVNVPDVPFESRLGEVYQYDFTQGGR